MLQVIRGAVRGSLKLRSIDEKVPDDILKWVLLPVFRRHKLVLFVTFSMILPLPNVCSEPHIVLWALKSPVRIKGRGSWLTRLEISASVKL